MRNDSGTDERTWRTRRWVWCLVGVVITFGISLLLSPLFPISEGVYSGWAAMLVVPSPRDRPPGIVRGLGMIGSVITLAAVFIGVSLLFGGLWSDDVDGRNRIGGLVIGGVLVVSSSAVCVVAGRRFRRREIDAEVERYRAEQETRAGLPSAGPGEHDGDGVEQHVRQDRPTDPTGHRDE